MRVKILETNVRLGVIAGEVYQAERYKYDPQEKVTLLSREPDGHDPECNQYLDGVAFWVQGQWLVVKDGQYVPEIS
jgi:hypothetical protein